MADTSFSFDRFFSASKLDQNDESKQVKQTSSFSLSKTITVDLIAFFEALIVGICALLAKLIYLDMFLGGSQSVWSYSGSAQPVFFYYGVGLAGALFSFFIMGQRGHYNTENLAKKDQQTTRILRALVLNFFLLLVLGYFLKISSDYSRGWMLTWFGLSFTTLAIERKLVISSLKKLTNNGFFQKHVVLFGVESMCEHLHERLDDAGDDINVIKTFSVKGLSDQSQFMKEAVTTQLQSLVDYGREHKLDRIIVALPSNGGEHLQAIMLELGQLPVEIDIMPSDAALYIDQPGFSSISGIGFYNIQSKPIDGWGSFSKRTFDLAISIPALILLAPLMLLIAAAIKLTSKGKVFFIQERHGLNEKVIHVFKFRSMSVSESGASAVQAKKNDARITAIGKILRKTSLDEIPQLINVVRGDMSLVGPRPHAIKQNEDHAHLVQTDKIMNKLHRYASRHNVKPGITGWAQVNGFRGETDTVEKMVKRVQHDIYYIHNWTIWMDMSILKKTIMVVIKGENAG